jgi:hypothetical protein
MNITKRVAILMSLFVIFTLTVRGVPDREFSFPAVESLKAMKTNAEIVAVMQVPADVLNRMPTSVLVKTCLDYPLHPDIVFYDSLQKGMDAQVAQFNGLQELMTRKDAGEELLKVYCATYPEDFDASLPPERVGAFTMKINYLELLLGQEPILETLNAEQRVELVEESVRKLETKLNYPDIYGQIGLDSTVMAGFRLMEDEKNVELKQDFGSGSRLKEIYDQFTVSVPLTGVIRTPCGKEVPGTITGGTTALTRYEKSFVQSYLPIYYPTATIVGDADPAYNCHGYAWHMSRESIYGPWYEKVTIQTTQPKDYYVNDGSYNIGGTTDVISYTDDHSAIPEGASVLYGLETSQESQYYISKWGSGYLMRHLPTDVPSGYGKPEGYFSVAPPHTVAIIGLTSMTSGQTYTFTSSVRNGCDAIPTYQWAYRVGTGSYINLGTSSSQSFTMGTQDVTLRLAVQKGAKLVYDYHTITFDSVLTVTISGPTYLSQGQSGRYTAVITGGTGTISSISWWTKFAVGFVDSHSVNQTITMGTRNIYSRVTVVKGGQTVTAIKTIRYTKYSPE